MRLPALTKRTIEIEDARVYHEQLYSYYLAGQQQRLLIPSDDPWRTQLKLSGNLKTFWKERGFRLRTHQTPQGVELWIESYAHSDTSGTDRPADISGTSACPLQR